MEQYDDTFEPADDVPTIKEIEKRLRRLGCTNEQVSRHLEQVTKGRTKPAPNRSEKIVLTQSSGIILRPELLFRASELGRVRQPHQ